MTKTAIALSLFLAAFITQFTTADDPSPKPFKALIVTGGCCHDYDFQTTAIQQAAADRGVKVDWTVVIHCAIHTYRTAKIDDWREFLGRSVFDDAHARHSVGRGDTRKVAASFQLVSSQAGSLRLRVTPS